MPDLAQARIAFAGTPEFARRILAQLLDAGIRPVLVLTQPDRPSGRGRKLVPSPVKMLASEHSLTIDQPERLRTDEQVAGLQAAEPDLLIVAAYGLILPRRVLTLPRLGCVNVHASLLPRWRGAAPIERAVMAGDTETGVCLMQMDLGLDTGAILDSAHLPILEDDTGTSLEHRLAEVGAARLVAALPAILAGELTATPQDESAATYAHKLTRADSVIDWMAGADAIARRIRALSGRVSVEASVGGARVQLLHATASRGGDRAPDGSVPALGTITSVKPSIQVACHDGTLHISRLRFTDRGKGNALSASEAANGFATIIHPGARFDVDG